MAGLALSGCGQQVPAPPKAVETAEAASKEQDPDAAVRAELAKLSPEDRALAEAQKWCAINSEDRLGEMGPPAKLTPLPFEIRRALTDALGALRTIG